MCSYIHDHPVHMIQVIVVPSPSYFIGSKNAPSATLGCFPLIKSP